MSGNLNVWLASIGAACISASVAQAQPVLITASQTISPEQVSVTPTAGGAPVPLATAAITVQNNAVLTINGRHSIGSLRVTGGGSLTHSPTATYDADPGQGIDMKSGFDLSASGDVEITLTGAIDVSGRGFAAGQGPGAGEDNFQNNCAGGAGHGGSGGNGNLGGRTYDSYASPTEFGSGGGSAGSVVGLSGGGAIRLTAGGTLTVNGVIAADGVGAGNNYYGAGAGGSIWITATTITGSGTIRANGGSAGWCDQSDGGGGRVAVYGNLAGGFATLQSAIQARGSAGSGAGSVYRSVPGQPAQLIYDNGGLYGASAESEIIVPTGVNVTVRNGAALSHRYGETAGLRIQVADNLTVESSGFVDVGGRGYGGSQGPGAGQDTLVNQCAGGGSHGGSGGPGNMGGPTYGSYSEPTTLGSGGGTAGGVGGLSGGGSARIIIGGTLTVNGVIAADGIGAGNNYYGAGAGGSIWITATTITGSGTIRANGGSAGWCDQSDGGGGRVAVYGNLSTFNNSANAIQAQGWTGSGAGTVYRAQTGQRAQLIIDNGGQAGTTALGSLSVPTGIDVILRNGGSIGHAYGSVAGLNIAIADNLSIQDGGSINVSGRGFGGSQGPGAGHDTLVNNCAGGGGYGGVGGGGLLGGSTYGSASAPTDLGSGGGTAGSVVGLSGGGAVKLTVGGLLTLMGSGTIAADGTNAGNNYYGCGSGGSIWIITNMLAGTGSIHANGGIANWCIQGDGGGGRVAVYSCQSSLSPSNITAASGGGNSGAGSVVAQSVGVTVARSLVTGSGCAGSTVALTASTLGGSNYRWSRNGLAISDGPGPGGSVYAGSSTSVLTITSASAADGLAQFRAIAANICGSDVQSSSAPRVVCTADFNCADGVTVQDLFDFLNTYFANGPSADVNGDGPVTVQDVFDYLNAWFAGC